MLFGIKSAIVWKKNLIVNLFTIKHFKYNKIKSYNDQVTDFHDKEVPKVGSNYACLAVMLIDFVLKKDENYYPQKLFKECKYTKKEKGN